MSCEFSKVRINGRLPACYKHVVLREIIQNNGMEGAYTPVQLKKEICNNPDDIAREQCHGYSDISENGRNSLYCK